MRTDRPHLDTLPAPRTARRVVLILLFNCALTLSTAAGAAPRAAQKAPDGCGPGAKSAARLAPGRTLRRALPPGRCHAYRLALSAGQFLHAEAMQRGVDVELILFGPDGREVFRADSPNGEQGPEFVMFLAERAGEHRLEVRASGEEPGPYEIGVRELRAAGPQDARRVAGARAFMEATRLLTEGRRTDNAETLRGAASKYEEARAVWGTLEPRTPEDFSREASSFYASANVHFKLRDFQKCLEHNVQALRIFRQARDRAGEADALRALGQFYHLAQNPNEALANFELAAPIFEERKDYARLAATHSDIGALRDARGERDEALRRYELALHFYELALRDRPTALTRVGAANALNNIGVIHRWRGEPQAAIKSFERALAAAREVKSVYADYAEAIALNNLGDTHNLVGRKQAALRHLDDALALFKKLPDRATEAKTLTNLGALYATIPDYAKALDFYGRALRIMDGLPLSSDKAVVLLNIGSVYASFKERRTEAAEHFDKALNISRQLKDLPAQATALNNLGHVYFSMEEPRRALQSYEEALRLFEKLGDRPGQATTLNNMGQAAGGLPEEAGKAFGYYEQALDIFRDAGDLISQAATLGNVGMLRESRGDERGALEAYLEVIRLLEDSRAFVPAEEIQATLSDASAAVALASVLLIKFRRPEEAFDLTEVARARTFLNHLGNARPKWSRSVDPRFVREEERLRWELKWLRQELGRATDAAVRDSLEARYAAKQREYDHLLLSRKAAAPEDASLRTVRPLRLSEVQRQLDAETTLLSYFVTADNILAYVVTRDSFRVVELPLEERDLAEPLGWFRSFATLGNPHPESLKQLHAWLVAPVRQHLKTRLVAVVPHRALHYVPFAALTDGGRYFGEEHTLFRLPSASVLPFIKRRADGADGAGLLAVAQGRAEGFPTLRYADREVREVARLFGARPLNTGEASAPEFVKRAEGHAVIHLAAHAELKGASPLFFNLRLGAKRDEGGALEVADIYDLNLTRASLVVLSACRTQLGDQRQGDDILGLNRAFMYAGTPTVVASLWTVDDRSTSELMVSFYRHLKAGMGKAEALRAAQADTRKEHPHPYHWAAFVLTGHPGPMPSEATGRGRQAGRPKAPRPPGAGARRSAAGKVP